MPLFSSSSSSLPNTPQKGRLFSNKRETEVNKPYSSKLMISIFSIVALFAADTCLKHKLLPQDTSAFVGKVIFPFTYPVTALKRITNYWTEIDDTLLLGCAPMNFLNHPKSLYNLNVRGVINLCDEYNGPVKSYNDLGIEQLHIKVVDHYEPSYLQMEEAIDFISKYKKRGERVLVHCKAGQLNCKQCNS